MRLIKSHKFFPDIMSIPKVIFRLPRLKLQVQEYYNPHWIEFTIWKHEKDTGLYVLIKWKKLPLNRYAYSIQKLNKLDSERIKIKAYLDKISEKR